MTIFKRIIDGELPCHKVYEDDLVLAFLDINPLAKGHTLVIPKREAATLDELDEESAAAIGRCLPTLAKKIMQATGTSEYNILQNNGAGAHQAVFHVHFHIIPKPDAQQGLGIRWEPGALDQNQARELLDRINQA